MTVGRKISQRASDATTPPRFEVKVKRAATRFEVWLCADSDRPELAGVIDARLAADAMRHGQDLVEELVGQALKQADRRREAGGPWTGYSRARGRLARTTGTLPPVSC